MPAERCLPSAHLLGVLEAHTAQNLARRKTAGLCSGSEDGDDKRSSKDDNGDALENDADKEKREREERVAASLRKR